MTDIPQSTIDQSIVNLRERLGESAADMTPDEVVEAALVAGYIGVAQADVLCPSRPSSATVSGA